MNEHLNTDRINEFGEKVASAIVTNNAAVHWRDFGGGEVSADDMLYFVRRHTVSAGVVDRDFNEMVVEYLVDPLEDETQEKRRFQLIMLAIASSVESRVASGEGTGSDAVNFNVGGDEDESSPALEEVDEDQAADEGDEVDQSAALLSAEDDAKSTSWINNDLDPIDPQEVNEELEEEEKKEGGNPFTDPQDALSASAIELAESTPLTESPYDIDGDGDDDFYSDEGDDESEDLKV